MDGSYRTSRKNSLDMIELPGVNEVVFISGVASVGNWRGEYSYIRVYRP